MRFCLNLYCRKIDNLDTDQFCTNCGKQLLIGQRYVAIAPLAQGGMGRIWLGIDLGNHNKCIIKQSLPTTNSTAAMLKSRELFVQEADQLKLLQEHPQIPQLIDYIEMPSTTSDQYPELYLIEEYIDGKNLAEVLANQGIWQESQIIDFLQSILPVIIYVHQQNIIHRDLKPQNIIFCAARKPREQYILIDFGAAKSLFNNHDIDHQNLALEQSINPKIATGTIIGSAEYIAPEQLRGKATFQSDLYSLGVTCLYLLTGVSPFDLYDDHLNQWQWENFLLNQSLTNSDYKIPSQDLTRILNKMIAHSLTERYTSGQLVLDDILNLSSLGQLSRTQSLNQLLQELTKALALEKWQEADQITTKIMLSLCHRRLVKQITADDINNLKNQEIWQLEQLWSKYSKGHFGFVAQLSQWQNIGGRLFYAPDEYWRFAATYLQFSSRLQWRKWAWLPIPFLSQKWRSYENLIFSTSAPKGHLPSFLYWEGCNITDVFLAKISQCISLFA